MLEEEILQNQDRILKSRIAKELLQIGKKQIEEWEKYKKEIHSSKTRMANKYKRRLSNS